MWSVLGVTCLGVQTMSLDPWLSFLTLALFLYVFVSSSGMLWLHDSKDDCGPVGVPNLFQKEEKATLFPRVHIGYPKILMDSNHPCQGDGVHWSTSCIVVLLSGVGVSLILLHPHPRTLCSSGGVWFQREKSLDGQTTVPVMEGHFPRTW